ncbi:hypothetical protein EDB81DRAFT_765743 [Dactylonectria macrodidyma]|uniref:Uncharacterized protein n=1 Tax=Dactylonectria macrodidyma TaxID=307937 RepID=A0A9P9DRG7_9HYPO|nr:hypothetical protein EDB81DRAFT_765743 [Dactylonectria macrodidyma]
MRFLLRDLLLAYLSIGIQLILSSGTLSSLIQTIIDVHSSQQSVTMTADIEKTPSIFDRAESTHNGAMDHLESQRDPNEGLKQKLNTRHLTFISLGSVIGR